MRVLLIGEMSGTRDGREWPPPGSTIDLPDDEAAVLCKGGMARPVATEPVATEVAVPLTTDVAQAVVPTVKHRGRPPSRPE